MTTLSINHISKILPDGRTLLDDISFVVQKGEFVGILGASGAGKTLTLRSINGLMQPTSGTVVLSVNGHYEVDLTQVKGKALRQARQRVAMVFQGFNLVKRLTALENVLIGKLGSISPWRSILLGFTDQEAEEALQLLAQMGVEDLAFRRVATLSGGEMQRVAIARALFQNPNVLLADEPISSLDPSNALGVMNLLAPLKEKMPVVGVFHQPAMTARFCSRVIGLKEGKVIYDGDPKLSEEQLYQIYGQEIGEVTGG